MTEINLKFSYPDSVEKCVVVEFSGKMDVSNLPKVEEEINPYLEKEEVEQIVFDFKYLEYLNSRAVGFLVNYFNQAQQVNKKLIIVNMQPGVEDTLTLVGLTQLISVYKTLEEGLEVLKLEMV